MTKLEGKLYDFEKEFLKKIKRVSPPSPGGLVVHEVKVQQLLLKCANHLADVYYKGDAQKSDYSKRMLSIKLYPLTESHISKKELALLNKEADDIYGRIKKVVMEDGVKGSGKYSAIKLIDEAVKYRVNNLFK